MEQWLAFLNQATTSARHVTRMCCSAACCQALPPDLPGIQVAYRCLPRPIGLRLLHATTLQCEVSDDDPGAPVLQQPEPLDGAGRGLYLVSKLAARWGVGRLPSGKVVWFELTLPDA